MTVTFLSAFTHTLHLPFQPDKKCDNPKKIGQNLSVMENLDEQRKEIDKYLYFTARPQLCKGLIQI